MTKRIVSFVHHVVRKLSQKCVQKWESIRRNNEKQPPLNLFHLQGDGTESYRSTQTHAR